MSYFKFNTTKLINIIHDMCEIYRTGRIYKIVHTQSNIVYVGSTFSSLRERWRGHKKADKRETKQCVITKYIHQYGPEQFKILLIKEYQVYDRKHLEMYEQLWINKLACINKYCSFKIKRFSVKHENKNYYQKNKEKELERCREKGKRHWICDICNITTTISSKYSHLKTKKHQKNIIQQK